MWRSMSNDTGVTDFCIAINGWILFSLLHVKIDDDYDTTLIIFNHAVFERSNYK